MPSSWQECVIEELATDEPNAMCIGPFGSDLLASDLVDHGVPVIFVRNVRPGRFSGDDLRYVTPAKAEKLRSHRVRSGDIVVTKMGLPPCIAAAYPQGAPDGIVTADIIKMSPNTEKVDPRYLIHFLNSPVAKAQVARFTFGVTRPKVTLKDFRALRLSLPPLPEQRRIADILDKADAIRRKRKEAIALTEELLRSAFLEMFGDPVTNPKGWEVKPLRELLTMPLRNGLSPASGGSHAANVLTLSAITRGNFDATAVKQGAFALDPWDDVRLDERDFLICRGNGNLSLVGAGAFPTVSDATVVFPDTMIAARVNRDIVARSFLASVWKSRLVRQQIEASARTTNGTYKVNQTVVESISIPVPDRRKQEQFEVVAHRVAKLLRVQDIAADDSRALFEALVHRAFRGELTAGGRANGKSQLGLFEDGRAAL